MSVQDHLCSARIPTPVLTGLLIPASLLIILAIVPPHAFDLSVSKLFFSDGWPWHRNEVFTTIFYRLPKLVPAIVATVLLVRLAVVLAQGRRILEEEASRRALYVVIAMGACAAAVWWLKSLVGRALRRRPSDDGSRLRPHGRSRPLLALGTRGHGLRLHCLLLCAQGRPPACCSRRTSLRRRLRAPVRRGPRHGRRALRLARARHGHRRLAHLRGAPRAHPRGPQLARLRKAALRKGPRPPDSLLVDVRPQHAVSCTRRRPLRAELRLEHARGPDARGPLLRPSLHLHSAPHARHGAASSRAPRRSRAPEPDRRDLLRGHARLRHCVRPEHGPQRHLHRRTRGLGLFLRTHAPARSGRRPSARPRCLRGRHDARRPQAGHRAWRRRHPCTRRRCRRAIHADEHACGRHAKRQGAALPHHARQRPLQPRHHARKGRLARCGPKAHRRSEARVLRQAQPSRRPSRRHRRDHPLGELGARRLRPRHHARASRRRRDQPSVRHGLRLEHRRFASLHAEQDRPLRLRPQPHHRRGGSAVAPRPCGRARRLGRQPERLQGHVCGHRGTKPRPEERRLRLGPVL